MATLLTIFVGECGFDLNEQNVRQEYARKWDGNAPLLVYKQFWQSWDFTAPAEPIEYVGHITLEEFVALRGNFPRHYGMKKPDQ